jgi:hypothetical protein
MSLGGGKSPVGRPRANTGALVAMSETPDKQ